MTEEEKLCPNCGKSTAKTWNIANEEIFDYDKIPQDAPIHVTCYLEMIIHEYLTQK